MTLKTAFMTVIIYQNMICKTKKSYSPDRFLPIASISSTYIMHGARCLASLKRSRTLAAPNPTFSHHINIYVQLYTSMLFRSYFADIFTDLFISLLLMDLGKFPLAHLFI